jgi:hypothetical protein
MGSYPHGFSRERDGIKLSAVGFHPIVYHVAAWEIGDVPFTALIQPNWDIIP